MILVLTSKIQPALHPVAFGSTLIICQIFINRHWPLVDLLMLGNHEVYCFLSVVKVEMVVLAFVSRQLSFTRLHFTSKVTFISI
jgi:hypothetical protein